MEKNTTKKVGLTHSQLKLATNLKESNREHGIHLFLKGGGKANGG
jgi:hypothetical protein